MSNTFVIADPDRCLGCYTCAAACTVNHRKEGLQSSPRLFLTYSTAGTMPVQCHHCEDAPCAQICPVKAISIQDGMVFLNEGQCIGCKMCAFICPFGAITMNGTAPPSIKTRLPLNSFIDWTPGVKPIAIKCDLCSFNPNGPECVRVCPTKALQVVAENDLGNHNKLKRLQAVATVLAIKEVR
jgi:hydrogenase-4 component A